PCVPRPLPKWRVSPAVRSLSASRRTSLGCAMRNWMRMTAGMSCSARTTSGCRSTRSSAWSTPPKSLPHLKALADATALPFPEQGFDAVVSLDVLEHIPAPLRAKAATEMARVAGRAVIVGFPPDQPWVRDAE
ncbi:hypothetical protein C7E23_18095, partial [Elizabethkingia anophelis]